MLCSGARSAGRLTTSCSGRRCAPPLNRSVRPHPAHDRQAMFERFTDPTTMVRMVQQGGFELLQLFHRFDPKFYLRFRQEANNRQNPRLNRWLLTFTTLDFAISINATKCANYLSELGAPRHPTTKRHGPSCIAILIEEESFVTRGGVNIDGLTEVTTGYYCAKCER